MQMMTIWFLELKQVCSYTATTSSVSQEPLSIKEAISLSAWFQAMRNEYIVLVNNQTLFCYQQETNN